MNGSCICVAILRISFICAMIVKEIMGIMRVPESRVLVRMHLNNRNPC
ncbi:MAG: hypothetical protein OES59_04740 [Gammaproteobacteria bacterium]|nr:hypothetical protein [Gammaproteobacteria bacterium]MDH3778106.1 hypothetical protein [Gammaproteobacteria bacterium]MDH3811142.1 hypothetical protein [Gammaproteobacteria bacterium]